LFFFSLRSILICSVNVIYGITEFRITTQP